MNRKVTEADFRICEFIDANPDDYEFRDDGKIVRKDRWKKGIFSIASMLDMYDFEIDDVVATVRDLMEELNKCVDIEK